ncbi:MAG: PAS domain S-box protein [Kiritimatiellae bacterium]|nr:PAS domain S-box protein [Kiritimatiellia bacterium]
MRSKPKAKASRRGAKASGHGRAKDRTRPTPEAQDGNALVRQLGHKQEVLDYQAALLANVSDAIIGFDTALRVTSWNQGAERLYGYTAAEAVGHLSVDVLQPEYVGITRDEALAKLRRDGQLEVEIVQSRKDGLRVCIESRAVALKDSHGALIGFATVNRDITKRKQTEDDLHRLATEVKTANAFLDDSRRAALNLMDDAVAARKRMQQALDDLRESREDLQRAQAVAHVGSWRLDVRRNVLHWSDETWRIYDIPQRASLTYETFLDAVHPDDRALVDAKWAAALRGEPYDIEHRILAGAKVKWVRERAELEFDKQGALSGGFGTCQDVTDLREAQQAARDAHQRAEWLARFPQENPEPILRVSFDGLVLYRNAAATERAAWAYETGQPLRAELRTLVTRAVARRQAVEQDLELGGQFYSVAVAVFPEEGYVNLYGRDVTARVVAEREVARASEEWGRTFDSVPDLIAILDTDHRIVRVNKAMAERLGRPPDACIGLACYESVHGCCRPIEQCPHAHTLLDGKEHVAEISEARLHGEFLVSTTPLMDAQGCMIGVVHVARDITERKRAEDALRESEERYRTLFNSMTEGFALHEIVCDREGRPCDYRFLDINPAFERLTGLKRERVLGRTVLEIMPGTESVWIERYGRVALTGEPDRFEFTSGELGRHYEVTASRTAPGRFAVIFTDITQLRAMQQREQEDAIRLAWGQSAIDTVNAMRVGVALLEMDGVIRSVNPELSRMTGLDADAVVGLNVNSLLPDLLDRHDRRRVVRGLVALRRDRMPNLPSLRLRRADGTVCRVLPSLALMSAPANGHKTIVLTIKDVTDLHVAAQRLEQSEQKYRELVENANSIIMRLAPDHTITFFNEYAQAFFGYTSQEILGRNVIGTIAPGIDSEGRDLKALLLDVAAHPEQHASSENENVCRDGRRVWIHWSNRAIRDDRGAVVEILCVGTDITVRRNMEAEALRYQQRLRALAERLATAEEEERWRISRYIHDTIVQELSLSNIRLGAMEQSLVDARLDGEADRLRQVRKLLEHANDECRMVMANLTPALLYELGLMPALNDLARRLTAKHGVRIRVEFDGQEHTMSNPLRGMLFESSRELIMNALKHAGPCEIRVSLKSGDEGLQMLVADTGRGFDQTVGSKPAGHQGGFGLFSIRQRLEGLGGHLSITSTPGQGTTATISMPWR